MRSCMFIVTCAVGFTLVYVLWKIVFSDEK